MLDFPNASGKRSAPQMGGAGLGQGRTPGMGMVRISTKVGLLVPTASSARSGWDRQRRASTHVTRATTHSV